MFYNRRIPILFTYTQVIVNNLKKSNESLRTLYNIKKIDFPVQLVSLSKLKLNYMF